MPLVSVIVPCRDEIRYIHPFMRCLLGQRLPEGVEAEILIADGMSRDGTREALAAYSAAHPSIVVIDNPRGIVSPGLNECIRLARGEVVVRMDVHSEYAPDYIRRCLEALEESGAENVGGPARTMAEGYVQGAIALAYGSGFACGGARFHDPSYEGWVDTVTFGCWRRRTLEALGLFDEALVRNQDDELNLRLVRRGGRIWQTPRIRCWFKPRSGLRALFRQYAQYGYWKVYVIRRHRQPASVRHLVPAAFVGGMAGLAAASPLLPAAGRLLGLAAALYGAAALAATARACRRGAWKYAPVLPAVFAAYHFAYGFGFLGGVWRLLRDPGWGKPGCAAANREIAGKG